MPETVFNHPSIKKEKLTNICALQINSRRVSGTVWLDLSVTAFLNIRQEWKRTSGAEKKEGSDSLLSFCQNTRHLYQVFFGLFSGYENLSVRQITIVNLIISLCIKT
ncbi:hypothetical protein HF735_004189 [Salmonella enterica]|nr:hypothetical protein [Salmonella enterica]EBD8872908.1 hypothetical protein [Salmonella enterica]EBK9261477.1 hypothetical protein [Salmonella enterica]EBL9103406.1 hypothetical protein [Salmonella enterica]EBL9256966.1 hypothetical protein [Salmonella enterica]